jgi:hypothetical protein
MKLNTVKRIALGALVGLSLTGGSLATFAAGSASADTPHGSCYGHNVDSGRPCSTN